MRFNKKRDESYPIISTCMLCFEILFKPFGYLQNVLYGCKPKQCKASEINNYFDFAD